MEKDRNRTIGRDREVEGQRRSHTEGKPKRYIQEERDRHSHTETERMRQRQRDRETERQGHRDRDRDRCC